MLRKSDLPDPTQFLPLSPATFHILIALADQDRHGYSILLDVAERTGGRIKLSAGTLYGAIKRMLEDGWIEEVRERPVSGDDERRRYYTLTELGRGVAEAEARRLESLLEQARATGLEWKRS